MTMTEPQIDPGMAEDVKNRQREDRGDQTPDFDLPEADQAPDPTAPAEMTPQDEEDIAKLQDDSGVEMPAVSPANILDLKQSADAAAAAETAAARKAVLEAHAADGGLVYTQGQSNEITDTTPKLSMVDHPTPSVNSAGEPVEEIKPQREKSWFKKLLRLN